MSKTNDSSAIEPREFSFEGTGLRVFDNGETEQSQEERFSIVAKDLAKLLGYRSAETLCRTLDDDEKGYTVLCTLGGPQRLQYVNLYGFNRACMKRETSFIKDPKAKAGVRRLQRWMTHEVMPQVEKTGEYHSSQPAALSGKALLAAAVLEARKTIESLEAENKELRPKAAYADMVGAAENALTMPQMAKILSSHGFPGGVVKLYRRLREDHVVYRRNGRNLPCQRFVDAGLFTARISPYEAKGHHFNGVTMLVTPKGSRWLAARYCPTAAALPAADTVAPVPTWQNAFFVEEARGYQGEGYPTLHVFDWRAEAEDWAATHDGRPVDRKQGKQEAEDIAGLRVEALGWTWDGTLDALRHLPAFDAPEFVQAVADVYALDAGPWTGNIVFHC